MRRLARRLFTLSSAVSLIACVAVCVLWLRSGSGKNERLDVRYSRWLPSDEVDRYCLRAWSSSGSFSLRLNRFHHPPVWLTTLGAVQMQEWREAYPPGLALFVKRLNEPSDGIEPEDPGFNSYHHSDVHQTQDQGVLWRFDGWVVTFPAWLPAALLMVLPALWAYRARAARRARQQGLCASCGYDLRATPGRCPECGSPPRAAPSPEHAAV